MALIVKQLIYTTNKLKKILFCIKLSNLYPINLKINQLVI